MGSGSMFEEEDLQRKLREAQARIALLREAESPAARQRLIEQNQAEVDRIRLLLGGDRHGKS